MAVRTGHRVLLQTCEDDADILIDTLDTAHSLGFSNDVPQTTIHNQFLEFRGLTTAGTMDDEQISSEICILSTLTSMQRASTWT